MFLTKKYIKKINKNAFTLVEISIVILIVSVMIVGIATGSSLIAKSRLANAKSLTRQSVINDMGDDLIAWYETSLEGSFKPDEIKTDGSSITVWKDSNKNAINKNDAFAMTPLDPTNQPKLFQNVFYNSIPGLKFSGAQYFTFNGSKLARSSYTVFVVEQIKTAQEYSPVISSTHRAPSQRLSLGYQGSRSRIFHSHFSNDFFVSIPDINPSTPRIHTFLFNNTIGKQYTLNGKNTYLPNPKQDATLESFNSARIGLHSGPGDVGYYYVGDLAEIIMFKRSLKTEEVEAIESYLGSKYGIPVS